MRGSVLVFIVAVFILCIATVTTATLSDDAFSKFFSSNAYDDNKWAILVSGSRGWENYRHQADVCHAYQVLINGGLKKENIIVMMYDDIAFNFNNPTPHIIVNSYDGPDVYAGVAKDYSGDEVNAENFYNVLLGNEEDIIGGNGRVLNSDMRNRVFIYFSGHGNSKLIGMPAGPPVSAEEFTETLKKMSETQSYKSMVIYLESCHSGSMFENILPDSIDVYATTAANSDENSFATYCPSLFHWKYDVCLGDMYSVSWLENCDNTDLDKETLGQQYEVVRKRVAQAAHPSHVLQFGASNLANDVVSTYMGRRDMAATATQTSQEYHSSSGISLPQLEASLFHFHYKLMKVPFGSSEYLKTKRQLDDIIDKMQHEDDSFDQIGKLVFVDKNATILLDRPIDCFKKLWATYEEHCGRISQYGLKHGIDIQNMCDAGVTSDELAAASIKVCSN